MKRKASDLAHQYMYDTIEREKTGHTQGERGWWKRWCECACACACVYVYGKGSEIECVFHERWGMYTEINLVRGFFHASKLEAKTVTLIIGKINFQTLTPRVNKTNRTQVHIKNAKADTPPLFLHTCYRPPLLSLCSCHIRIHILPS